MSDDITATEAEQPDEQEIETTGTEHDAPEPPPPDESGEPDDSEGDDRPSREAAKYRRRLRDAETERDQLAQRLEAIQRAEVERLATAARMKPAAVWASGAELADLLTEDGAVDEQKVSDAITAAREAFGLAAPPRNYVPREGSSPSFRPRPEDAMVSVIRGNE